MLTKRIIPCLDVKGGRVVKGVSFVNLHDAGDPVEIAKVYDEQGADELTFLDITASHEERGIILDIVRRTAEQVFMPLTVGRRHQESSTISEISCSPERDKVSINTTAVHDPEFIKAASMRFGSQCIVVAIDAKQVVAHDKDFKPPLKWADDPKYRSLFLSRFRNPQSALRTAVGSLHPRRQKAHGHRCRRLGTEDGRVRRWRDTAHEHGPGRPEERATTWS